MDTTISKFFLTKESNLENSLGEMEEEHELRQHRQAGADAGF
jgi:hypothetical protein